MREIKFRGKRLDNGEWVYGSLIIFNRIHDDERFELTEYCISTTHYINGYETGRIYKVDPATIGQFTGLEDKNGTEIYEGDMLRKDECFISYVKYCTPSFYRVPLDKWSIDHGAKETVVNWGTFVTSKVIGNIYDNPEC